MSHRNANYESPDAIRLSLRESRLQRQLFIASSRVVRAIVSAPVISVRINVQLEASSIMSGGAKQTGKSIEGTGRSCSSRCPSCPVFISHTFLSFACTRGSEHPRLVLARQNLTKQFAPKQTTASGLLVNKQHIYFQKPRDRNSFVRTTASESASICRRYLS